MHIVVGTAGHIDHGKTALVKALTGIDADRLPEEKKRGITIELGFAEMSEGDVQIGFVDVPGHERFVKNMLAGASGIDLVLLVVAADEGVMPQTREHFDICRLLDIKTGVVALTKSDLVDAETLSLARMDVEALVKGSFLEAASVIAVSSQTGQGVSELKKALTDAARSLHRPPDDLIARLPIDRSFAVKGFGTVATGTLASGKFAEGAELELLPEGKKLRVRGVQSHGRTVGKAVAGRRTAVNLAGVDHHSVHRGSLLAEPGVLRPAQMFDAEVEVLDHASRPLRSRQRIRLHIGTAEILARVSVLDERGEISPGRKGFVQLRLESPVAAVMGERFIIRSYSPQITIAGGSILRPATLKPRRAARRAYVDLLTRLSLSGTDHAQTLRSLVDNGGENGIDLATTRSITGWRGEVAADAARSLVADGSILECGRVLISRSAFADLAAKTVAAVRKHHEFDALSKGLSLEALRERVFRFAPAEIQKAVISSLASSGVVSVAKETVSLSAHSASISPEDAKALEKLRAIYKAAGVNVPKTDDALAQAQEGGVSKPVVLKLFHKLLESGEVVQVTPEFCFAGDVIADLIEKVRSFADRTSDRLIDVPKFKELAGVSRKYAIPLLEYFDREKVTVRRGDKRYIL